MPGTGNDILERIAIGYGIIEPKPVQAVTPKRRNWFSRLFFGSDEQTMKIEDSSDKT